MNFVGIFFQLLITGMFYKCGSCPDPEPEYTMKLSDVHIWGEEGGDPLGVFESTYLHKYKNEDSFYMHDMDNATLFASIFPDKLFSSAQLEFLSLYEFKLQFLFENGNKPLYVMCQFSNEGDIQTLFDAVNFEKPKNDAIDIYKVARYIGKSNSNPIPQIGLFAEQAELSVRDITNPMSVAKRIIYYISHTSDTGEKVEIDLIFQSAKFSVSPLYNTFMMALCVEDIPDVYFIIRFSDPQNPKTFVKDNIQDMQNGKKCKFPELSPETIEYLNN